MLRNQIVISDFMMQTYESGINKFILSDKNFVVPHKQVLDYIEKAISIPYSEFIDYIKDHKGVIEDDQLTQSSNFNACSSEICHAILSRGNPGMKFIDIGQLFLKYIKQRNDTSFRKYGENQIKTSAQLGLSFEYYGFWYLSCIGYVYNDLTSEQQAKLLARTILRIPLYQNLILSIIVGDVYLTDYMKNIAYSTQGRRAGSIMRLLEFCLNECKNEGIKFHDLYYPVYNSKSKDVKLNLSHGTAFKVYNSFQVGFLPLFSLHAACGYFENGEMPEEEGWVDASGHGFTPDPKRYFVVHAKGDSMLPKIKNGDLCVFEWYQTGSRNGEIVLTQSNEYDAEYGGKYTIKKYHSEKIITDEGWQHNKVELLPLNPDYKKIELSEDADYRTIGILKCIM